MLNPLATLSQETAAQRFFERHRTLLWPLLTVGTLFAAALVGVAATQLPLIIAAMLVAGIVGLLAAFSRPELIILAMLIIHSSIFIPDSIPTINVGFSFSAVEIAIMLLLGLTALRILTDKDGDAFVHTPLDWPVFLFFLAATASFFNAIYNLGTYRGLLVYVWRTIFDYLIFFTVTNHIKTRVQLKTLVGGMFTIAGVVAVLVIIQAMVGTSVQVIPSMRVITAGALDESFSGVARVIPPGTPLMGVMLVVGLVMFSSSEVKGSPRRLLFVFVLVTLLAILMTFSRSLWLGILLALMMSLFWVRSWNQRRRVLIGIVVMGIMVIITTLIMRLYIPRVDNVVLAVNYRFESLFAGNQLVQDQQQRLCEVDSAIVSIQEHPLFGVGPGGHIHVNRCPMANSRFVHNSFLFIMAAIGILSFIPFVWFSLLYLGRGVLYVNRIDDWYLRNILLGFSLAYVAMLVMSSSGGELLRVHAVPVLGAMFGISETAIRLSSKTDRPTT